MSDKKEPTKKAEPKKAKIERKAVEPTEANIKIVREKATVIDYSLAAIRKALSCTWKESVALRHAALKADKK